MNPEWISVVITKKIKKEKVMKRSFVFMVMFLVVLGLVAGTGVAQAADGPGGTWILTVAKVPSNRAGVAMHPKVNTLVMTRTGDKIAGNITSGSGKGKVEGTVNGNDFELKSTVWSGITLKGKVEGAKCSGTITYNSLEGTPESDFTGKRK
jgi:hypothetical protein